MPFGLPRCRQTTNPAGNRSDPRVGPGRRRARPRSGPRSMARRWRTLLPRDVADVTPSTFPSGQDAAGVGSIPTIRPSRRRSASARRRLAPSHSLRVLWGLDKRSGDPRCETTSLGPLTRRAPTPRGEPGPDPDSPARAYFSPLGVWYGCRELRGDRDVPAHVADVRHRPRVARHRAPPQIVARLRRRGECEGRLARRVLRTSADHLVQDPRGQRR